MMRRALPWLVPAWLLLAWLFQGVLTGEAYFQRDMVLCFFPLKTYVSQAFAAGAFPDWWPYDSLGQPMASLPIASLFHPTTLLYALLPLKAAWVAQTLCSVFLAPLGTWFLARTVGLRAPAAGLATTVVAISFWHVLLAEQTQMHLAAASLPWFWRESIRVFRSRRGSVVVLALATANMVVGGDPMLLELAAVGVLILLATHRWKRPHAWARLAGAGVLGLGLGGVQAVPMAMVFGQSPRSASLGISLDDMWALRPSHFPQFVLPAHHGTDLLFDTLYIGLPTLLLAAIGLARPWRFRWPLLALGVVLTVTAFGRAVPLWHVWSAVLPGWRGFQFPLKALGPAMLPLALLAGRGLQSPLRRWAWPGLVGGGVVLGFLGLATGALHAAAGALGFVLERRTSRPVGPARLSPAVAMSVMTLLAADVAVQLGPIPTQPFEFLTEPAPLVAALKTAGVGLETGSYEWSWSPPKEMERDVPDWRERDTALVVLLGAPSVGATHQLPTTRHYLGGITRRVFEVARATGQQDYLWRKQLSQVFGAIARLQKPPVPLPAPPEFVAGDADLGAVVLRLPKGLPRAYVAFAATPVADTEQVSRLNAGIQAGFEVLLAPEDVGGVGGFVAPGRPHQPVQVSRDIDTFAAEVQLDAPGVLVINEAFANGWSATVDGAPAKLVPANHAVMGLVLPAGAHRVALEYRTPGLTAGIVVSAVSALLLAAWWWARRSLHLQLQRRRVGGQHEAA